MQRITRGQLTARINGQPLLYAPAAHESLMALPEIIDDDVAFFFDATSDLGNGRPYRVDNGVAVIPVHGSLLHRVDWHYPGYATGYDYITALADAAMADPSVRAIALDISSPGGEMNGCFDCADVLFAAAQVKPMYAVVDGYAYSAAYALASQAQKIYLSETAGVGSIGVVTMHVDYSKALKDAGIKVTMIFAGDHKVDGNPYEPLPADVKARIEARVQKSYAVFVSKVDRGRDIGADAIRATEADCYAGPDAVEVGLADAVMSPREAFAAIKGGRSGSAITSTPKKGVTTMSADKAEVTEPGAAAVDTAAAPATAAVPVVEAAAPAAVDPKLAERERVQSILGCEEAKGRASLASHLAFSTDLGVDEARKTLSASAVEQAAAPAGNALEAAMAATGGGAGVEADAAAAPVAQTTAQRILANQVALTGVALKH